MAQKDWRVWLFAKVNAAALLANKTFGAGSLRASPAERPFAVIRMSSEIPTGIPGTSYSDCTVWVHDDPGDYMRIDSALKQVKQTVDATPGDNGGIAVVWQGDSADLADDGFGTIAKTTSFRLIGRT